MVTAQKFITDHGKPNHTQVERVVESGETTLFKSYFHAFDPPFTPKSLADRSMSSGVAGAVGQKEIDVSSLQANAAQADTPVDDGSGKIEIWRIEDFKKVEVAPEKYGQFYGGDSYILLYTYMVGPREEYIIYFWQGKDSSKDEKGASGEWRVVRCRDVRPAHQRQHNQPHKRRSTTQPPNHSSSAARQGAR